MAESLSFPKDYKIPGILLALGVGCIGGYTFFHAGPAGLVGLPIALGLMLLTQLGGILIGLLLVRFLDADLGPFPSMLLKLAAIVFVSYPVLLLISGLFGLFLMTCVWVGLLIWLFEWGPRDAMIFAFVAAGANFLIAFYFAAQHGFHD
jgi:hypothetical protein